MTATTFRLDRPRDGVVVLTLDRPERSNAMTATMFAEPEAAALGHGRGPGRVPRGPSPPVRGPPMETLHVDLRDSGAHALVVRGAGEKAFGVRATKRALLCNQEVTSYGAALAGR